MTRATFARRAVLGAVTSLAMLIASLSVSAQIADAPQTPRQALIEMFLGDKPDHMERHLPEVAKKALKKMGATESSRFLGQISMIAAQAKASGGSFQIMETGTTLLLIDQQNDEKLEVTVERDDLVGDGDQIDLSFHMYRKGVEEKLPFLPRLSFVMTTEAKIWRLSELSFSGRMPLNDPDFLRDLIKDVQNKQRISNEGMASFWLRTVVNAESSYKERHPDQGFTCSLPELAKFAKESAGEGRSAILDDELAGGKKDGYIFALTGCDKSHFKVAAEPAAPESGGAAFCSDESGVLKSAKNGKATTCLVHGETRENYSGNVSVD